MRFIFMSNANVFSMDSVNTAFEKMNGRNFGPRNKTKQINKNQAHKMKARQKRSTR
jgi:hypothetical protein